MLEKLAGPAYAERMRLLKRPGVENILAFYEHRIAAICTDGTYMLMPWDDHLVHRGDGLFEVLKFVDRHLYQLDAHIQRLRGCASSIFLEPPCSWEEIRQICLEVAQAAEKDNGLLRIMIGRGSGGFSLDPKECPTPSLYVAAYHFAPKAEEAFQRGVTAFRSTIPAKQPYLARIKSTDYLPNVLMRMEATAAGKDYPFCFNEQGFLAEGATENVCLVDRNDNLIVPDLSFALQGTTLMRALELVQPEININFKLVREEEILQAKEVIVLSTTVDAISVVRFGEHKIATGRPGPVSLRIRELLKQDIKENGIAI